MIEQQVAADGQTCKPIRRWPWWTTFVTGRIYRPVMRLMHRHGWCYPQLSPMPDNPSFVWCHWCGMRGDRPESTDLLVARMSEQMAERDGSKS
jgi:hypothetical protein